MRLARKEPQRAIVRGRVFEIGAPDERDGSVLLTVWEKGRPVGHVLPTDPPSYRPSGPGVGAVPQPVSGVEELIELLGPHGVRASRATQG
ncbi:hypothetical protein [Rathayibacter tanaceti]|uniref:Uncharacterized protein n=1 Tax=Rathayibacter tanaceti TaxID=1671680 RepID=A0AAE6RH07_9MICO|nr:hypothetical protein [Rathayibacter tanaceti]QHC54417.1 hypothetical protein GSU10_01220 [Rathayibacter tanaceti]